MLVFQSKFVGIAYSLKNEEYRGYVCLHGQLYQQYVTALEGKVNISGDHDNSAVANLIDYQLLLTATISSGYYCGYLG